MFRRTITTTSVAALLILGAGGLVDAQTNPRAAKNPCAAQNPCAVKKQ